MNEILPFVIKKKTFKNSQNLIPARSINTPNHSIPPRGQGACVQTVPGAESV